MWNSHYVRTKRALSETCDIADSIVNQAFIEKRTWRAMSLYRP